MFSADELDQMPKAISDIFKDLERQVLEDILNRLEKVPEIIPATDYQMWRLFQIGYHKRQLKKFIQEALKKSEAEVDKLYKDTLQEGFARDSELYEEIGKRAIQLQENEPLKQILNALAMQTKEEFKNITATTGYIVSGNAVEDTAYFRKALDRTATGIITGSQSYQQSLKQTVNELVNSGLRYIDYESGHVDRVDVATRRAVMTGVRQVTGKVAEMNAEALGTDKYEVSAHATARPDHQKWQGKVYTYEELVSVCGLGTGPGLCGWNCYHHYDPFIEGVSERKYTDEELEQLNADANKKALYGEKEYTKYEATQEQRRLEREMRGLREKIDYLKKHGGDKTDIQSQQIRYNTYMERYKDFSEKMGLPFQIERVMTGQDWNGKAEKVNDEFETKDVTASFRETRNPGIGEYHEEPGANPSDTERKTAEWLIQRFGGNIEVLKRQETNVIKTPDYRWDGKLWDEKTCSSLRSIADHISDSKDQIRKNPGGVICNIPDGMEIERAMNRANGALKRIRQEMTVILKQGENVAGILEHKKR